MRGILHSIQVGVNPSWRTSIDLEAVLFVIFRIVCTQPVESRLACVLVGYVDQILALERSIDTSEGGS